MVAPSFNGKAYVKLMYLPEIELINVRKVIEAQMNEAIDHKYDSIFYERSNLLLWHSTDNSGSDVIQLRTPTHTLNFRSYGEIMAFLKGCFNLKLRSTVRTTPKSVIQLAKATIKASVET